MASKMCCLLLVTVVALVLLASVQAWKRAPNREFEDKGKRFRHWYCPQGNVIFKYEGIYWCVLKCAECPNGFCYDSQCLCFPGTRRDRTGVCGKMCSNCENGWCSTPSKCVCNKGFILTEGRCVRQVPYNNSHPQLKNVTSAPQRPPVQPRYATQWPQVQPQIPSLHPQSPPQAPSVHHSSQNSQVGNVENPCKSRPPVTPTDHPQRSSNPQLSPPLANRPDQPYRFEKVDLSELESLGLPQHQSCQIDYLWDPESKACVPYESAEGFVINPRMDD